ncbi:MAG: ribose 5-phosphate isomerase B [Verrucomicrobia subdivision 3 bacterium]|nr:ribose 5-phosphate isomerase B [Limisphaerales bacterium]
MKVALGADHAGFELKERVKALLAELKHEVLDCGTRSTAPVDYPDFAEAVGLAVRDGKADRGILVCGSGVGASVAANKIPGVRAGLCHDHYSAHQGVEHDDMNVLVMGGRVIGESVALELVRAFLDAQYSCEDRHQRRLEKVKAIEQRYAGKRKNFQTAGEKALR